MQGQYNLRSPAVKRLMREAQELSEPTEQFHAQPLEDNLFEWHFTIRGPNDSEFESGVYHGRIILPPEYPMKPPSIILLTPNGRFEIFKKICLSISGHHPESWQPSWSIRTALLAIIGFMPTPGHGAIGSLDYTPEERKVLAKKSQGWICEQCGNVAHVLKPVTSASEAERQEAKELASQIAFQAEKPKGSNGEGTKKDQATPPPPSAANLTSDGGTSQPLTSQSNSMPTPNLPGFPPFNPAMFRPPFGMPPFMPGMGQPPRTGVNNMTPPTWPNPALMAPGSRGNTPLWPQMWNPMMQQGFLQQQARLNMSQAQTNISPAPSSSSSSVGNSEASSTVASADPPTTSPASEQPASTEEAKPKSTSSSEETTSAPSSSAEESAPTNSSTTASTSSPVVPARPTPTAAVNQADSSPGLRQRATGPGPSQPSPVGGQGRLQSAELPRTRQQQEESPVMLGLMILLGLAIAALVARRLYMTDLLNFDL